MDLEVVLITAVKKDMVTDGEEREEEDTKDMLLVGRRELALVLKKSLELLIVLPWEIEVTSEDSMLLTSILAKKDIKNKEYNKSINNQREEL